MELSLIKENSLSEFQYPVEKGDTLHGKSWTLDLAPVVLFH